jgi:antibiotic biosynthesis monooxygenase (ABM) superfamily enzyme
MTEGPDSFEYHFEQRVDPRHLERFHHFSERMRELASEREGFISLERRLIERHPEVCVFRTSMRFNTIQQCMSWLDDPQRRQLLLLEEEEAGFRSQGQGNWFGYGRWLSRRIKRSVPTWKVNLLVLLTLYPTAMLLTPVLHGLFPRASGSTLMLVSNALCVAATSWLLVPAVSRAYRRWLEGESNTLQTLGSVVSLLLLIALFWWGFSNLPLTGGH